MARSIEVPIAVGELMDKISILEIKSERLSDSRKLANVRAELALLVARRDDAFGILHGVSELLARLKEVNGRIWDLEDAIRELERDQDFGAKFIEVARRIYRTNDERAAIKRQINVLYGSEIMEEKSYTEYLAGGDEAP